MLLNQIVGYGVSVDFSVVQHDPIYTPEGHPLVSVEGEILFHNTYENQTPQRVLIHDPADLDRIAEACARLAQAMRHPLHSGEI